MATQLEQTPRFHSRMTVPFMDLRSEHDLLRADLQKAWNEALDNSSFIGGAPVEQFELAFAKYCEVTHAIGVGNGTDALVLALKALGVGPGDEVITASNSFVATAEAIVHAGATPVFADINPDTYTIDVNRIEEHITPSTRVIIPVHLYGQPADMHAILDIAKRRGLRVVEDAAQAHGARYFGRRAGSMGDAACFSFYPAKNLGACGDAGAVVTCDPGIAEAVRRLRDHGGLKKYEHDLVGYNSRLDALQAAVLRLKLERLDARNESRRRAAHTYNQLLSDLPGIVTPTEAERFESIYHLYVIRVEKKSRDDLQVYLRDHGVQTGIHYPTPIHRTSAFARFRAASCPVAEKHAEQILSLPMFPEIEPSQLRYVAECVRDYATNS